MFCRKSGICYGTKCVILCLLEELEQEIIDEDDITETMLEDPEYVTNSESKESKNQISKYSYTINQIVPKEHVTYRLRDTLFEKLQEDIIVWELDRPTPDFKYVSGLENQSSLDELIEECNELYDQISDDLVRDNILYFFKCLLAHEPGTIGLPYDDESRLWLFLKNGDIEVIKQFYVLLLKRLKTANQYAVEHNVILFYCTGSHNNTSLLGGKEQSKSAIFYIAPYMAKEKVSLTACMTILEKSRKEIMKYPSKASDVALNPKERLTKHFLTRIINKLNAFIELSDYQVAAYLLNMPSIVSSEIFQYCETYGTINYRKFLIKKKKEKQIVSEDDNIFFGYVKTFTLQRGEEGNIDIKEALPVVSCYFNRGERLQGLSNTEYNAFVQIREKPKGNNGKQRSSSFEFANGFELAPNYEQVLCQKQKNPYF